MHGGRELVFQKPETVNEVREPGTINDATGKASLQVAEWSGPNDTRFECLTRENAHGEDGEKVPARPRSAKPRRRAAIRKSLDFIPRKQQ